MLDDYAASTATTGVLSVGGTAGGTIETSFDDDWFSMTLAAEHTYVFSTQGSGPNPVGTNIQLHDSGGASLIGGSGQPAFTYTATYDGTYFAEVWNGSAYAVGNYSIGVVDIGHVTDDYAASTGTTGVLSVGGTASGTIETSFDDDWFSMTLAAEHTYVFSTQGSGPDPVGTNIQLHDSGGASLIGGSGQPAFTYTATYDGTYFAEVWNGSAYAVGNYSIGVVDIGHVTDDYAASTGTTGVLSVGGTASGTIETSFDDDWFSMTLAAGHTYVFRTTRP